MLKLKLLPQKFLRLTFKVKVNLVVNIDKGDKVKISDINLNGVDKLAEKKVKAAMKKPKRK